MKIRIMVGSTLLAILPLGCSDTTTPPAPAVNQNAGGVQAEKTDKGSKIKTHTLPTGANPDAVSPGP